LARFTAAARSVKISASSASAVRGRTSGPPPPAFEAAGGGGGAAFDAPAAGGLRRARAERAWSRTWVADEDRFGRLHG
jgi:hypothetical protein